ncbi:hypothetical protein KIPB_009730 [Kipferlia bialata]|uniref:Uncharacterized protein n=1 Tax=Kipferlia bialata TaxID=797122 RepID=A0A391NY65_9EUKA|nr:hypothetical protein KIPB_009730 [Kipferlia bialata]|eukprot:g9730.t1
MSLTAYDAVPAADREYYTKTSQELYEEKQREREGEGERERERDVLTEEKQREREGELVTEEAITPVTKDVSEPEPVTLTVIGKGLQSFVVAHCPDQLSVEYWDETE